jgi:RimJ/RimL family protein N-acetyltransferase
MGGKIAEEKLRGTFVDLREVKIDDAEFILKLRCDEKKSMFLHKTQNDIGLQKTYLENYFAKTDEWYFISQNKRGEKIGTIRIYDLRKDSFCTGSWIMADGSSTEECFETTYLCHRYGFTVLGFEKMHIDVRKGNKKVLRFHKTMGAVPAGETELDCLFEFRRDDYLNRAKIMCRAYGISE